MAEKITELEECVAHDVATLRKDWARYQNELAEGRGAGRKNTDRTYVAIGAMVADRVRGDKGIGADGSGSVDLRKLESYLDEASDELSLLAVDVADGDGWREANDRIAARVLGKLDRR